MRRSVPALCALALVLIGCSDSKSDATTETTGAPLCQPNATEQPESDLPNLALIPEAVAALEAEMGGPQTYFEINATSKLVNLWVALNDGTVAQPWLYFDGQLSSKDPVSGATGPTFLASEIQFDPDKLLVPLRKQIPEAILGSVVLSDQGSDSVVYEVLVSAQCGGGLDVVVGPDGTVKSVDPVN